MEYKVIGYNWINSMRHSNVYASGYEANKYESPAVSADLTSYAQYGWRVANCWRTDSGTIWFVLER